MECTLCGLIGDVQASEQLGEALERMAQMDHTHDHATRDAVEDLKMKVEMLIDLVGDVHISEQIDLAVKDIKSSFFKEVI
jgi:hypothetical protein